MNPADEAVLCRLQRRRKQRCARFIPIWFGFFSRTTLVDLRSRFPFPGRSMPIAIEAGCGALRRHIFFIAL
jgi:hypothetical protein